MNILLCYEGRSIKQNIDFYVSLAVKWNVENSKELSSIEFY